MKQPKKMLHHIDVECKNEEMHPPPQHSCKNALPDWWRFE